jgi:putative hydrolase of the HAD superfamily
MSKRNVIALDIGGVCIQLHHDRAAAAMGIRSMGELPEQFVRACGQLECGAIPEAEWLEVCRQAMPQHRGRSDDEIRAVFNAVIGTDIPGMAALAQRLADDGYRLVYFSNTSQLHALEVAARLSFAPLVTGAVYSYEAGCMKPDPRIYEVFEERYGVPAFYFDDRAENIEAGLKRGWNSRLFTAAADAERFIYG